MLQHMKFLLFENKKVLFFENKRMDSCGILLSVCAGISGSSKILKVTYTAVPSSSEGDGIIVC